MLIILYEIGLIGIKLTAQHTVEFALNSHELYTTEDINDKTKFYIHKMFEKALKVQNVED